MIYSVSINELAATSPAISEQAQVSDWPMRILLTALTLAVIAFFFTLIARSWRRRANRQKGIGELPTVPAEVAEEIESGTLQATEVRYVGTASAVNWNDKIAYAGLANRGFAYVSVHGQGVVIDRDSAVTLFIPKDAIVNVSLVKGVSGRAFGKEGVVAIRWVQGDFTLDTGLRSSSEEVRHQLVRDITAIARDGARFAPQDVVATQGSTAQKVED